MTPLKPDVYITSSQPRQRTSEPRPCVIRTKSSMEIGHVVPEMCSRAGRQTDTHITILRHPSSSFTAWWRGTGLWTSCSTSILLHIPVLPRVEPAAAWLPSPWPHPWRQLVCEHLLMNIHKAVRPLKSIEWVRAGGRAVGVLLLACGGPSLLRRSQLGRLLQMFVIYVCQRCPAAVCLNH